MNEHTCHAIGCEMVVPPRLFMCSYHWDKLPHAYRQSVLCAYRPGQEFNKRPSEQYLTVAKAAIDYLRREEGH